MDLQSADNEPLFVPSTIVCKHDSKRFEYNNSAFDTAIQQATMKENQDATLCDLKFYERDTDSVPTDMKDKDACWNTPELECAIVVDDFSKADENEAKDSGKQENFLVEREGYTDKNVMEFELPELIVCYKESAYHDVKDICIDEGVPSEDKILTETTKDGHNDNCLFRPFDEDEICDGDEEQKGPYLFNPCNGDKLGDITKESVDIVLPIPELLTFSSGKDCGDDADDGYGTKGKIDIESLNRDEFNSSSENDSDEDGDVECGSTDSVHTSEENINATEDSTFKENFVSISTLLVKDFREQDSCKSLLDSSDQGGRDVAQSSSQLQAPSTEVISESPALESTSEVSSKITTANDLFYNSKVESGTITFDFNSTSPTPKTRDESPKSADHEQQPLESQDVPKHEDEIFDTLSLASQVQHCPGESSFSASGPPSGLITYSGPIAYSGSVSLRSDSSATSTRSFAFPVLQSDWNSSPVRMAKAERRHFRKHRGWRHGILCCRF